MRDERSLSPERRPPGSRSGRGRHARPLSGRLLLTLTLALPAFVLSGPSADTAEPVPQVRFTAVGDFSSSSNASAVLQRIGTIEPDLNLALGDLAYTSNDEGAWCDFVTQRVGAGFPFELVAGNHESNGQHGSINNFSACLPNQLPGVVGTYGRQYYVDVPQQNPLVRYVMISPGLPFPEGVWNYGAGSPRYQWTAAAIDGARTAGIPWVVVGMHAPCLSAGEKPCDSGADLMNLLLERRVDLVLAGHDHHYARSKQLRHRTGCPSVTPNVYDADCVVDSDASLVRGAGTVFVTVGTGGVELTPVNSNDPEYPYMAATSGSNANPTYGLLDVTLTAGRLDASFERASGGTFLDSFTIVDGPAVNEPPTASFTTSSSGLRLDVDASASFDNDGTITGYSWDFGEGGTGSGVQADYDYATPGTYDVRLTVTDDDGATDTKLQSVTVSEDTPAPVLAADSFGRSVTGGWGSADQGGPWNLNGPSANAFVGGGVGSLRMPVAGSGPSIYLADLASTSTDLNLTFSLDKMPVGGSAGVDQGVQVRRIQGAGDYRAKVRVLPSGAVRLGLASAAANGALTPIVPESVVPGLTYDVGAGLRVRVQADGTSPTTLRAKVWRDGQPEPSQWFATGTSGVSGLQVPGSVGLHSYLAGSVTNAPVVARFDDLDVREVGAQP